MVKRDDFNSENVNKSKELSHEYIKQLVSNSQKASQEFSVFTQEEVDEIVAAAAISASKAAFLLAQEAVEETKRGIVEDKDLKNRFATENIYNLIKHEKTVGIISQNKTTGQVKIASPLGVLAGIVPVTNPTSTTIFKALLTLKTRNTIIFAFHPQAQACSRHAAEIIYKAAVAAGAPENVIQWIEVPTIENTNLLMENPDISSIIATGGPDMVHAALNSGNVSLGVGPGNGVVFVDHTAYLHRATEDLLLSKRFDNGMVCVAENSAVVEESIYDEWLALLLEKGAYLVPKSDHEILANFVFNEKHGVNGKVAGMSARWIADNAGVYLPEDKDVMLFELDEANIGEKLSSEKLTPLLSIYKVANRQEGIKVVDKILSYQGTGHNAGIQIGLHNDPFVNEFSDKTKAARVLVNQPDSLGGLGDIYTDALRASLTLGTGSWGKNSLSHNLTTNDFLNIKTVAKRRHRPQWIRLPEKIYYEQNAISYLQETEEDIQRAFIVADPGMVQYGFVDLVYSQLSFRDGNVTTTIYGTVRPDPTLSQTIEIARQIQDFQPDTIIAIGGGSALDAAKIARYIYEYSIDQEDGFLEDYDKIQHLFNDLQQKFMDIRKKITRFHRQTQTRLIAIPTTSGTGSEVTPFAVITDDVNHVKYPLNDYELTPQVAIVDPEFVLTVPKRTVALSGIDTLAHAIEAYVSVMSSEFTRPWALQAIELVMNNLEESFKYDAKHPTLAGENARTNMHYAATLSGMAFANANLGLNHSIAHKTGGEFGLPHGLAIALSLIEVIRFNVSPGPIKRTPFPRYEVYRAHQDYAEIARTLKLPGESDEELIESLCQKISELMKSVEIEPKLSANGVTRAQFDRNLDKLIELIYNDQCTATNPRQPTLDDIRNLLEVHF